MLTNSDFRELLNLFEKHDIRYLVVGVYAVMKYSEPRFTKDLDIWIATDRIVDLLFRFLRQNKGRLSNRAREGEFAKLTARETKRIERIFNDVFADSGL